MSNVEQNHGENPNCMTLMPHANLPSHTARIPSRAQAWQNHRQKPGQLISYCNKCDEYSGTDGK